jgi:catechol 2,3-dioxygenase-like lactoylglutathione lyase family enzyme
VKEVIDALGIELSRVDITTSCRMFHPFKTMPSRLLAYFLEMEVLVKSHATATEPQVAFRSNSEIAIHVPDLARAEAFYAGVLGFRLVTKTDDQLEFDTGKLRLYVNRDPTSLISYIPSLDVPDYASAKRFLEAAGCKHVSAGVHSETVYFQDPFGLVFDIVERR